jgi:tetratricopeptide (TPR) repeat protein
MSVEDTLRRARLLAELGRYPEADPLLGQVLAAEPDHQDALATLARSRVAQGDFAGAEELTGRLLAAHPDNLRGLIGMARLQAIRGRPREGVRAARRAVALYPDDTSCLITLADLLNETVPGSAEALALAERALELDPANVLAGLSAADIHLSVARYADAEWWALRALAISPTDSRATLLLGLARAGLGRFADSRDEVLAALRLEATDRRVAQVIDHVESRAVPEHLAEIYRMCLAAAGAADLTVPGAAGRDPELVARQGRLAWKMYSIHARPDGLRRAGELAEAVLAADRDNADARYVRARRLCDDGRAAEALPEAHRLAAEGYGRADDALLVAQSGVGDHRGALATVDRMLARDPDSPMLLRVRAQCLRELDRFAESLAAARRAAELSPATPQVQLQLGLSARAAGDQDLAERALRLAGAQQPADGEPIAELALFLAQHDRWAEAAPLIARLSPDAPDLAAMLRPVGQLGTASLLACGPALAELDESAPDPALLTEVAGWLNQSVDLFTLVTAGHTGPVTFLGFLRDIVEVLRPIQAPPENSYCRAVRRLDDLLRRRGPKV